VLLEEVVLEELEVEKHLQQEVLLEQKIVEVAEAAAVGIRLFLLALYQAVKVVMV
jgi:hypothetical protein